METVEKMCNNNQNEATQVVPSIPHIGHNKNMYICIPHVHSVQSARSLYSSEKPKPINNGFEFKAELEKCTKIRFGETGPHPTEEPMDLTCTEKRIGEECPANSTQETSSNFNIKGHTQESPINIQNIQSDLVSTLDSIKRRGRKAKYEFKNPQMQVPSMEPGMPKALDNVDYFPVAENKQAEVLKAAQSLFSKRTRTLYHWMYPNAPKAQLKAAVASSWETLAAQEKEFYVSQVLGRFGFPQTNLMVNPQLGGMTGTLSLPPLDLTTANQEGNEETSKAVSSLLLSESGNANGLSCMQTPPATSSCSLSRSVSRPPYTQRISRKRGRLGRPPGSKNRKQAKEDFTLLTRIREDPPPDEFQDDPELSREFQQFRWTLHLNNNK